MPKKRQEATFKETRYALTLTCRYIELAKWIEEYGGLIFKIDGNTFDVYLPSKEFIKWIEQTVPYSQMDRSVAMGLLTSTIRFEILIDNPLSLLATHYYLLDNSQAKGRDFISWIDRTFATPSEPSEATNKFMSVINRAKVGRHSEPEDIWAYKQHYEEGRPKNKIKPEWKEKARKNPERKLKEHNLDGRWKDIMKPGWIEGKIEKTN